MALKKSDTSVALTLTGKQISREGKLIDFLISDDNDYREQVFRALSAFYLPYQLRASGAPREEIAEAVITSICELRAQISKIELTFPADTKSPKFALNPDNVFEGIVISEDDDEDNCLSGMLSFPEIDEFLYY